MEITPASSQDIAQIRTLLHANGLPLDGFPDDCAVILALKNPERVVGGSALEIHSEFGLLRSVIVDASVRGVGLGERLVSAALIEAGARGLERVFLLSETAAGFFPRFGFQSIARQQVPAAVRSSVEFRSACPETAQVMVLELTESGTESP